MRRNFRNTLKVLALGSGFCLGSLMAGGQVQAGDVAVALEGSLLKITGSNTADTISVVQTAAGDVFVSAGAATTISGRPSVVLRRVSLNAVEIRMEGGNDSVTTRGLNIGNDLYVNLGAGNDRFVTSGPIFVGNNLTMEGEGGSDVVRLVDAEVAQDLYIDGGLGTLNASIIGLLGGKGLTVIGDESNDQVTVSESMVLDTVAIETKGGADRVSLDGVSAFAAAISTDLGADVVLVNNLATDESIGIFTGVGADQVTLANVETNTTLIVSVDAGDDRVSGQAVTVGTDAVFEGGAGVDSLSDLGITAGIKKEIKEFENVTP